MACTKFYDEFDFSEGAIGNPRNIKNLEKMLNEAGIAFLTLNHGTMGMFHQIYISTEPKVSRAQYDLIRPFFVALGPKYAKRFADEVNNFGLFGRAGKSTDGREDTRNFSHVCHDNEEGSIRSASIKRYIILLIEFYGHELHDLELSLCTPGTRNYVPSMFNKHAALTKAKAKKSKPSAPGATTTAGGVTTTPTRGAAAAAAATGEDLSVGKPPKPAGPTRNPAVPVPVMPNPKSPTFYVTPTPYVPANNTSNTGTQLTSSSATTPTPTPSACPIVDISDAGAAAVACAFLPMKATVNSILSNPSLAADMSDDLRSQLEILQLQIAQANRSIAELIKGA